LNECGNLFKKIPENKKRKIFMKKLTISIFLTLLLMFFSTATASSHENNDSKVINSIVFKVESIKYTNDFDKH